MQDVQREDGLPSGHLCNCHTCTACTQRMWVKSIEALWVARVHAHVMHRTQNHGPQRKNRAMSMVLRLRHLPWRHVHACVNPGRRAQVAVKGEQSKVRQFASVGFPQRSLQATGAACAQPLAQPQLWCTGKRGLIASQHLHELPGNTGLGMMAH